MAKLVTIFALCVFVTFSNGLPLEDTPSGQFVIDIPAGKPASSEEPNQETKIQEPTQLKADDDSVEVIPLSPDSASSEEDGHRISSISDLFNIRIPFSPMFVYRRPVIRDPFDTPYQASGSYPFGSTVQRDPSGYDVMNQMEAMMRRMQQQMTSLWSFLTPQYMPRPQVHQRPLFPFSFDLDHDRNTNDTDSSIDSINVDNLPSNYSNSTSETKVIDGQLVQVNKTIHKVSNNDSSSFFQVQVIKIRPQTTEKPLVVGEEESQPEEATNQRPVTENEKEPSNAIPSVAPPPSQAPAVDFSTVDPQMNEIDELTGQQRQSSDLGAEPFPYLLNRFKGQYDVDSGESGKPEASLNGNQAVYEIVPLQQQRRMERMSEPGVADLSGDIRVNRIMEEQNKKAHIKMVHPDVELIDI